jgi:hypothetical protein
MSSSTHIHLFRLVALSIVVLSLLLAGCSEQSSTAPAEETTIAGQGASSSVAAVNEGVFDFEPKYTLIKSYPTGGGIFVLRLIPGEGFSGDVNVTLSAHKSLGAELCSTTLSANDPVAEIMVSPMRKVMIGTHTMTVTASNPTHSVTVTLSVEVVAGTPFMTSWTRTTFTTFVGWLKAEHPELGRFNAQRWDTYATYPGILVVEHWTYLSEDWEFRICYHVMMPPDDWSMMQLRRRGEWDPSLAARREWNGEEYVIFEIPVEDYPVIYGY